MEKKTVVFCSHGYGSLGLIRTLGEAGYRPECYCYGDTCDLLLASKYVSKGRIFESAEEAFEFLLNDYPCYQEKPFLFTIPDVPAYLVDRHLDQMKEKFVLMSAGEQGRLGYWMDKRHQADLARKHGLMTPWTITMTKQDEIPDDITYPVFTKSIRSVDGGKDDESICRNRKELEEKKSMMISEPFLVMKYIKKKQERCYFGMSVKGKVYIDYNDELNRFREGGYGYYNTFRKCKDDAVYRQCVSMMEEIGYDGLFDIEFLLGDDGLLYFMEINFRVDGAIYKVAEGVNLPDAWISLACMDKRYLPEHLTTKKDCFTGITEIHDFRTSVLTGQVNPLKWFWQFCSADRRISLNFHDPKPLILRIGYFFKNRFRKR